ncbi:MAG: T9SS type A sorting domain-containing protein [Bacteroidetes bacterium]|nr:T9SS type A sorting domain-containing protein [Bacteroidota bacterium]
MRILPVVAFLLLVVLVSAGWAQDTPPFQSGRTMPFVGGSFSLDARTVEMLPARGTLWASLAALPADERANTIMSVSLPAGSPAQAKALAGTAAMHWNEGDCDLALRDLAGLASLMDMRGVEVGMQQKNPVALAPDNLLAANVRIGTVDTARHVGLVCDSTNMKLFAVTSQEGDGSEGVIRLFMSTNAGDSWSQTHAIYAAGGAPQVSITLVRGYLYMGYFLEGFADVRVRRFLASTGALVPMSNGEGLANPYVAETGETLEEVKMASNYFSTYNNRIYCGIITSAHKAKFFWAIPSSDTLWYPTGDSTATPAREGLSMTYAFGTSSRTYLFRSYVDTGDGLCIDSMDAFTDSFKRVLRITGARDLTSISAYYDTVVCTYNVYRGTTSYWEYRISYNRGENWSYGRPVDTLETSESPLVCLDKGQGMGIFYRFYLPSTREGRMITRSYQGPGAWTTAATITDYVPHYWPSGIAAMGNQTWGVAYITFYELPARNAVVFAKYQFVPSDVEDAPSGVPQRFALYQNFPNPFNPSTEIRYDIPSTGQVRVAVFDMLGREVAGLFDGNQTAGQHAARWNAGNAASGVYLCRVEWEGKALVQRMMMLK